MNEFLSLLGPFCMNDLAPLSHLSEAFPRTHGHTWTQHLMLTSCNVHRHSCVSVAGNPDTHMEKHLEFSVFPQLSRLSLFRSPCVCVIFIHIVSQRDAVGSAVSVSFLYIFYPSEKLLLFCLRGLKYLARILIY